MRVKPNWIDNLVYRLFRWRWNRIFASRPDLRELFIAYLRSCEFLDDGDEIKVTVTIEKAEK